jgi:hypothetical protein
MPKTVAGLSRFCVLVNTHLCLKFKLILYANFDLRARIGVLRTGETAIFRIRHDCNPLETEGTK